MGFTESQQQAITARGNVLVEAGAGTGKTSTLVQRCLSRVLDEHNPLSLDRVLMVTFTEAAAAEMRQRLRTELSNRAAETPSSHLEEQLALLETAHISTLHGFCLQLVREHFHELGLDPQLSVLDEGDARVLAAETLEALLERHYAGESESSEDVRQLILTQFGGREFVAGRLIQRLHEYAQTLADPAAWFEDQLMMFSESEPKRWEEWLIGDIQGWRHSWMEFLREIPPENGSAQQSLAALQSLPDPASMSDLVQATSSILAADGGWPNGKKTVFRKPLEKLFDDASFLQCLIQPGSGEGATNGLVEDWKWVRLHMITLVNLAREFAQSFAGAKREMGGLDFHDLEQFALRLLWDHQNSRPSAVAGHWRQQFDLVFVDEYQDINAAQDKILLCLSREGERANRFLVGDVKQSIYRFRLADPRIFRRYTALWRQRKDCHVIPLAENFRSHEGLLNFINPVFRALMRVEAGGVDYDTEAELRFGAPEERKEFALQPSAAPRVELHLRFTTREPAAVEESEDTKTVRASDVAERTNTELEARLVARRLLKLKESGLEIWDNAEKRMRPVDWRDMVVLLRSPRNKAASFAREFELAGIPLEAERGGFYEAIEISDLISLIMLLDNPQQDVPLLAVLRSPLAGLTTDELAEIRLADPKRGYWWALRAWHEGNLPKGAVNPEDSFLPRPPSETPPSVDTAEKVRLFLTRFARWRQLARQGALSRCLETILDETHYEDWLLAQERGEQRRANVRRLLQMTREFDPLQRQGLFRFIRHVEARERAGIDPEPATVATANSVRLMSIHKSKGLEFPVVVMADLGCRFNLADLQGEIILDERYGICPQVKPPGSEQGYPGLTCWLARKRQRRELLGEELRLLYVGMTRASDRLILAGSTTRSATENRWALNHPGQPTIRELLAASCHLDWLGCLLPVLCESNDWLTRVEGGSRLLQWRVYESDDRATQFPPSPNRGDAAVEEASPSSVVLAEEVQRLESRLAWTYPQLAATLEPAKTSATAFRRRLEEDTGESRLLWKPRIRQQSLSDELDAASLGIAHHKFLQHLRLDRIGQARALEIEADRMIAEGILPSEETAILDLEAIAAFWYSELGERIRAQAGHVRRELPFTVRFSPNELAGLIQEEGTVDHPNRSRGLEGEFAVVQGVVDLALFLPKEILLVDFKTDRISKAELPDRARYHSAQLRLYAAAINRVYGRPVSERWLHFLSARESVRV